MMMLLNKKKKNLAINMTSLYPPYQSFKCQVSNHALKTIHEQTIKSFLIHFPPA